MTNREREARRWWRQAVRDAESADINRRQDRHEVACFLGQQAAEKALYPNGLTDEVAPLDFSDAHDSARGIAAARSILDALERLLPTAVTASDLKT
jgi:hypothetical protein